MKNFGEKVGKAASTALLATVAIVGVFSAGTLVLWGIAKTIEVIFGCGVLVSILVAMLILMFVMGFALSWTELSREGE